MKNIVIVTGDPNSINSEVIFKSWKRISKKLRKRIFFVSNINLLKKQFKKLNLKLKIVEVKNTQVKREIKDIKVINVDLKFKDPFKVNYKVVSKFIQQSLKLGHKIGLERNISGVINCAIDKRFLAKKYSEDKNSSFKGGRLNPFSSGQINSIPFENAAFNLEEKNQISDPVETKYGWHLIKLYDKKNIKEFDEIKYQLLNKLKKSSRFNMVSESFYSTLLKRYSLSYENKNLDYFISMLDSSYFTGEWSIPENIDEEKTLITIHDKILKYIDFATFLEDNQKRGSSISINQLVYDLYKKFIDYNTLEVYKNNLEKENSDYRFVIKEYREGLLLFNIMQEKIWTVKESD